MAILKIAQMGNPILRIPAEPVKNIQAPDIQRLIDDMTIRNMSPSTIKIYVYAVAKFSRFYGRPPDKLTF